MQLSRIQLNCDQRPRIRPEYPVEARVIPHPLTADYRQDIRNQFIITINSEKKQCYFPLTEVSLLVKVKSNRQLNLIGVMKNVMDALNGLAYQDDINATSFLIKQEAAPVESTEVSVITGTKIKADGDADQLLQHYTQIQFSVEGQISDRCLPVPPVNCCFKVTEATLQHGVFVQHLVTEQYRGPLIDDDIFLSFDIVTNFGKTDIDNIVLEYLVNMKGIVFTNFSRVKQIHATIAKAEAGKECCVISIDSRNLP